MNGAQWDELADLLRRAAAEIDRLLAVEYDLRLGHPSIHNQNHQCCIGQMQGYVSKA